MSIDYVANFRSVTETKAPKPDKIEPMQLASNIWDAANFVTVGGVTFNPTPYATVGGRGVCHGAAGVNRSGAFGLRPIFCPK